MNVLVTGSSGFIAGAFVKRLLKESHFVVGLDIKPSNHRHENYSEIILDITEPIHYPNGFPYVIDQCFHFAAVSNLNYARQNQLETMRVNVLGTANVLHFCRELDVDVFNYISTCCIFGHTPINPTPEDAPKLPTEIYGQTKLMGEWMVTPLSDLPYNILRPATTYGPTMRRELAIYIFLQKALKDEPIPIHGTGLQTRCFVYVDDLVDAFMKVIKNGITNEAINLAGEEMQILSMANMCRNICHSNSPLDFVSDRPNQVVKEQISVEKAKELLQWQPRTDLVSGLKETMAWVKNEL